ncbi:MAG: InlB B-repeat-containing protein, partial [Hominilimicola sp.]
MQRKFKRLIAAALTASMTAALIPQAVLASEEDAVQDGRQTIMETAANQQSPIKTWDFENGNTAFTNVKGMSLSVVDGTGGNTSKVLSAATTSSKPRRAWLDFSNNIPDNATEVRIEFDAADSTNPGNTRMNYILYDNSVRNISLDYQNINTGSLFQIGYVGNATDFRVNNTGKKAPVAAWAHVAIDVDYKTKKTSYTVTSMDGTTTYLLEDDIAYYDTSCSKVTGLEIMNRSNGTTMYIDNIKLYAVTPTGEQPEEYSVKLNVNGGTINSGNITKYTFGEGAMLPTDVTRSGYTFGGWYDSMACTGTAVTAISKTDIGKKEYWAKWTAQTVEPKPDTPAWPTYQKTARVMEKLDRGLTAVKMPDGVYLSWRLLGTESLDNQAFDIYRSTNSGLGYARIATSKADGATCYTDTSGTASYLYKVVPAGAGQTALDAEKAAKPWTTGSECDKY